MNEFWINSDSDWKEFRSFLKEEGVEAIYNGIDQDGNNLFKTKDMVIHVPIKYMIDLNEVKSKKYDPLIFGKDSTERIVNITVDNELAYVYKADGSVDIQEYYNWAVGTNWDEGCTRLKGFQYYKFFKEIPEDQFYMLKDKWNPRIWTPRTASEGYMIKTGMTYYKGMKVSDVSLLSFDLEAPGLDKDAEDAQVPLLSVTYRSKKGEIEKRLFDIFDYDEDPEAMWADINEYVREKNPDIILGHNILSYDLPYADANSPGLDWGRDGSRIIFDRKTSKMRKDSSQQYEYFNGFINGREIIDTFFLSIKYDIAREFPSYGLKAIEKHLGLVKEDRTWDFNAWPVNKLMEAKRNGNHEIWEKFRQYCQDDSDSPIKMFDIMIPSFFYLCQSVPKTLQQVINEASGSQLDSLMIRSYLQDGYSLPRSSRKEEFEGAISMGVPGIYKNVRKVDVASLYPSIMLQYNIYDKKKDPNRHMLTMLEYFRNERLANKKLAKETGDKYYDDMQNAQKIVINSMYGFLGAGFLLFNYPEGAAEVTRYGRAILLKGVEWATGHTLKKVIKQTRNAGTDDEEDKYEWIVDRETPPKTVSLHRYNLVNVDTDSFSYTDNSLPSKKQFDDQLEELNALYPDLIRWEKDGKDGLFDKIIVVKAKNYVLVREGKVKLKGSSLTDQKKEPRLLKFLRELIDILLNDNNDKNVDSLLAYNKVCREVAYDFKVSDWVTKKTVTKSILEPKRANEQGPKDAIDEAIKKGVIAGIQEGDKVWLYVALDGEKPQKIKGEVKVLKKSGLAKMIPNDVYRFPQLWSGDQYAKHYLERIHDTAAILENVVDISKFIKYHSPKQTKALESLK